jgi:hypothetical protein
MKNLPGMVIWALAVIFVGSVAVFAQDGGISVITTPEGIVIKETVPAEEISREQPREMEIVVPEPPPPPPPEVRSEPEPIHVVEAIKRETPAADAAPAAKTKESEYVNALALGARINLGNAIGIGGYFKIPVGASQRIDAGLGFGIASSSKTAGAYYAEASGFYEWRFDIDDGVLGWYAGPGAALGWYWTNENVPYNPDTEMPRHKISSDGFGIGLGGVIGLEVDLSFIDADHSLYSLKDILVGMNVRPMLYSTSADKYPAFVWSIGLSVRWSL